MAFVNYKSKMINMHIDILPPDRFLDTKRQLAPITCLVDTGIKLNSLVMRRRTTLNVND